MSLRNLIGSLRGYGRCPVTGDTFYQADLVYVRYRPCEFAEDIPVSARVIDEARNYAAKERIAQAVHRKGRNDLMLRYALLLTCIERDRSPEYFREDKFRLMEECKRNLSSIYAINQIVAGIPDSCQLLPWEKGHSRPFEERDFFTEEEKELEIKKWFAEV